MTKPTLEDIFTDIRNIAKIFRIEDRGEALIEQMTKDVEAVQAKLPKDSENYGFLCLIAVKRMYLQRVKTL